MALSGTIATNRVQASALATVSGGSLTAHGTGNVSLDAENTATIDATTQQAVDFSGTSGSVVLAFNTVGYAPSDIGSLTLNALVGTQLGTANPSAVQASISNTTVVADGALTLNAVSTAHITSTLGNELTSSSSAMFGASTAIMAASSPATW